MQRTPRQRSRGSSSQSKGAGPERGEGEGRVHAEVGDLNTPPKTTAEQDISTAGQRRVNLIWESMQALLALSIVWTVLFTATKLALVVIDPHPTESQNATAGTAFMLMGNLVSLVIGFYFGRTNHQRTGGVGSDMIGR